MTDVRINITGKKMELGESLQSRIEDRLNEVFSKYLDKVNAAEVVVTKESHLFRCDIQANLGTHSGVQIKSRGESEDVYSAFDAAAEKCEKQLRRYKRRITNHNKQRAEQEAAVRQAVQYTLAPENEEELAEEGGPAVIAETPTQIETLTVSEAVMRMDLADLPALTFYNSANGMINFVYRRPDGNISWVDVHDAAEAAA